MEEEFLGRPTELVPGQVSDYGLWVLTFAMRRFQERETAKKLARERLTAAFGEVTEIVDAHIFEMKRVTG